jgi:hypothetical protein
VVNVSYLLKIDVMLSVGVTHCFVALAEFSQMGIDYLAGIAVTEKEALRQTIAEGGGVRIFETRVQYRCFKL